ncbi:MAG: ABC transporter permease [Acidobacteria bacterium]|nr:ABC transporter permease [Acidobacteriota bacterium]
METILQDLRFGARMLLKSPGFTLIAVLSLVIGIGANSAIFSVVDALLFRPLPYQDADRLVILWNRSPGLNVEQDWFSPGQYIDVRTQNQVFEKIAVTIGASFNMTGRMTPERVDGARVSSSFFQLFELKPVMGRVLLPEEDKPKGARTAILSNRFWQSRFGSDAGIVGQTMTLNGNSFEIVGVLPADFSFDKEVMPAVNAIQNADIFLPLPMSETAQSIRTNEDFNIFAKLKPGISVAQAQADMNLIAGRMKEQYPEVYPPHGGLTISVVPLLDQVVGDVKLVIYVLFGAVGFVLLIACANVANLLLARSAVRQKEIAVRSAMGAGRSRILRQLLTESMLLSLVGGALGLAFALLAVKALHIFGPENIPRLKEISINGRALVYTFSIALLTGIVFGLAPALRASKVDVIDVLKDGARGSGTGHDRLRKLLIVIEIALSLVLLIGAVLLVRSYQRIITAHPGFNPQQVLSFRLSIPVTKYPEPESVIDFYRRVTGKIGELPGVLSVGTSYSLPMSSVAFAWEPVTIEGYVPKNAQERIITNVRIVSSGYFSAMGIPLVKGRLFDERDTRGEPGTVIIDEAMARRFWPDQDPIGRRMRRGDDDPWRTIIGIISDAKQFSPEKEPPIAVYYPSEQINARSMFLVIRTDSDPADMTQVVMRAIKSVDPEVPAFDLDSMEQRLHDSFARRRLAMVLLAAFALVAMLLAAIGIYGVISYWVEQRTHEIGIRMAIGARPFSILGLVISQTLILVLFGITIGLICAIAVSKVISSMLFNVSATDLFTFAIASIILGGVALLAGFIPALRAIRVDPMVSLRSQ